MFVSLHHKLYCVFLFKMAKWAPSETEVEFPLSSMQVEVQKEVDLAKDVDVQEGLPLASQEGEEFAADTDKDARGSGQEEGKSGEVVGQGKFLLQDAIASEMDFVVESEDVELQSFIDAAWASFRESKPGTRGLPEAVRRAEWMRYALHTLTSEFLVKKSFESKIFAHRLVKGVFVPLLAQPSADSVQDDNADGAAEQTDSV